ncbi:hypothetical protein JCM15519_01590 [Fundidesulfovibrio butyratiphilus]
MPHVSVIISLYNHGRYLSRCVESALAQTYGDLEVVIVDDASTDDSLQTAYALQRLDPGRVAVHANPENRGVSRTRNFGVYKSSGDILAFLDADDYWRADKIEMQVRAFRDNPELGLCHTGVSVHCDEASADWAADNRGFTRSRLAMWSASFQTFSRLAAGFDELDHFRWLLASNLVCLSSVALRRQAFKRARGFVDGRTCQCEDWLLWLKLSLFTRLGCLAEPLTFYRFHPQSHTAQVFFRPDFDQAGVRNEMLRAARNFDPARFDELFARVRTRTEDGEKASTE